MSIRVTLIFLAVVAVIVVGPSCLEPHGLSDAADCGVGIHGGRTSRAGRFQILHGNRAGCGRRKGRDYATFKREGWTKQ